MYEVKKIGNLDDFINSSIDIIKVEAFNNDVLLIEKAKEKLQEIEGIAYLSSLMIMLKLPIRQLKKD